MKVSDFELVNVICLYTQGETNSMHFRLCIRDCIKFLLHTYTHCINRLLPCFISSTHLANSTPFFHNAPFSVDANHCTAEALAMTMVSVKKRLIFRKWKKTEWNASV